MDPRDTPGYRTQCALSTLTNIDVDDLDPDDRDRIESAIDLLDDVSFLEHP